MLYGLFQLQGEGLAVLKGQGQAVPDTSVGGGLNGPYGLYGGGNGGGPPAGGAGEGAQAAVVDGPPRACNVQAVEALPACRHNILSFS